MYPPKTCKWVSLLFPLVLIMIIGELFIPQTSAFFIEITDKNANDARITLYECDSAVVDGDEVSSAKKTPSRTAISRVTSLTNNKALICNEVVEKKKKQKIYKTANFYLVTEVLLEGGKQIMLVHKDKKGSRPQPVLTSPAFSVLVGVTLIGEVSRRDYGGLLDPGQSQEDLAPLIRQCRATPIARNFFFDQNFQEFVLYLSAANFDMFLRPSREMIRRFKLFGELVKWVEEFYNRDVCLAKQNNIDEQTKVEAEEQTASATRFLIQKLIDPCFFLAVPRDHDAEKKSGTHKEAETQCENYCKFLAVAFKSNGVTSSKCNGNRDTLVSGTCYIYRCYCEKESYMMTLREPEKYYSMIECSNELRLKVEFSSRDHKRSPRRYPSFTSLASLKSTLSKKRWTRTRSGKSSNSFGRNN